MFCKNCDTQLDDNQKFCPKCGTPVQQGGQSDQNAGAAAQQGGQTQSGYQQEVNNAGYQLSSRRTTGILREDSRRKRIPENR